MTPRFKRSPDGQIVAGFDAVQAQVLRIYVREVRELLEPDDNDSGQPVDPLEELTGMHAGPGPSRPTDPALVRLFPDAYGPGGETGESGNLDRGMTPHGPGEMVERCNIGLDDLPA